MKISDVCKSYFSGFQEASNFKKNDSKTNALALLKILSYFTVVIPLGFAAVYGAASLCGRVSKKQDLSSNDKSVNDQAKKTILKNDSSTSSSKHADVTPFLEKAKIYAEKQSYGTSGNLLDYITKILNKPEFQADPEKYMKDWKQKRGNTEEFRIPEDQAMSFFENEVLPNIKFISKSQVNISELEGKAKIFVEGRNYSSEISAYIQGVLDNPLFQHDPQLFMDKWKEKRGFTEEFRIAEDSARMFFEKELHI